MLSGQSNSADSSRDLRLPARVQVAAVRSSRYSEKPVTESEDAKWFVPELDRPLSWDARVDGIDVIETTSGELVRLKSSGMQSVPKPGWVLLLTAAADDVYSWTLYGIPPRI